MESNEQFHYEDIPDDEEWNSVTISKCIGSTDETIKEVRNSTYCSRDNEFIC